MEFEAGRSNGACRFYKGRIDEKKWIGGDGQELERIHTLKYKSVNNGYGLRSAPLTEKQIGRDRVMILGGRAAERPWSDCYGARFEI